MTELVKHIQNVIPRAIEDIDSDKLQIKVDEFGKETFSDILKLMDKFEEETKKKDASRGTRMHVDEPEETKG